MRDKLVPIGAINAFIAVAAGAFGAHGLKGSLPADRLTIWGTAAHYHLIHSVALVLAGALVERVAAGKIEWVGRLFLAGIILFSGSLYALALTGTGVFGAITPLGGLCFLSAWAILAATSWKRSLPPE